MGASGFQQRVKAKTVREAFDRAVSAADAEYGHRQGYSGAVNAKHSVVEVTLPSGMRDATKLKLPRALADYDYADQELEYAETPAEKLKWRQARDKARTAFPTLDVQRLAQIYSDKWGPALALRLASGEFLIFGTAPE